MSIFDKKVPASLRREFFGLHFDHPVGIAPGADPEGHKYNSFSGCSFVEIGPLSPAGIAPAAPFRGFAYSLSRKEETGMSSLKQAILNIQQRPPKRLIMANLAPLPSSSTCEAVTRDLLQAFTFMYDFADLFVIDTFRRNKDGVAPLQSAEFLSESMDALIDMRFCYERSKPILVRVDGDIQQGSLAGLLDYMMYSGLDGIIAGSEQYPLDLVKRIGWFTGRRFPVIACGGIEAPEQADALLEAGADLLQVDRCRTRKILNHLIDKASS